MTHNCPVCRTALVHKIVDGVGIDECAQCAGVWIPMEGLRTLESRNIRDLEQIDSEGTPTDAATEAPRIRHCPECGIAMLPFHFMHGTNVLLDRCDTCDGIWADHGELTQMARALQPVTLSETARPVPVVDNAEGLAQTVAEHSRAMARSDVISSLCSALSMRLPYV